MTYNEVNIIAYYLIIPMSWCIMLDVWLKTYLASIILILVWGGIIAKTYGHFREWSDRMFMKSVDFLNWFNRWGGNYILNSVIICVVIPLVVYVGLLCLLMFT